MTLDTLAMALAKGTPFSFHSDQSSQYAAKQHTKRLQELSLKISMSDKANLTHNGWSNA